MQDIQYIAAYLLYNYKVQTHVISITSADYAREYQFCVILYIIWTKTFSTQ